MPELAVYNFSKGWHPEKPLHLLETGELAVAENLTYRDNFIPEKRRGFELVRASYGTGAVLGMVRYKPAVGAARWVFAWDGDLFQMWDDDSITAISGATGYETTPVDFAIWKDTLFFTNGGDGLNSWDGTTLTDLTTATPSPLTQPAGFPITGTVSAYDGGTLAISDGTKDFITLAVKVGDIITFTSGALDTETFTITKVETSSLYVSESVTGLVATDTYSISVALTTLNPAPAGATYVCHFQDRLWLASSILEPDKLFYSRLLDYNVWNDIDTGINNSIDISIGDNQRITGMVRAREHMTIFKERSMFYLMGYSPEDWKLERISDDLGCISHRSIAQLDSMTIWLSGRGVYMDDGNNFMRIGEGADTWINAQSYAHREATCAVISGIHYYLHFPDSTDGSVILDWNGRFKVWTKWVLPASLTFSCLVSKDAYGDTPAWMGAGDTTVVFYTGDTGGLDHDLEIQAKLQPGLISAGPQVECLLRRFIMDLDLDIEDRAQALIYKDDNPVSYAVNGNEPQIGVRLPRAQLYSTLKVEISLLGTGTTSKIKGFVLESIPKRKTWGRR